MFYKFLYKKNYGAFNKFNKRILFKSGLTLGSSFMNVTFLYDRTSLLEMNRSYTALENKSFLYKIPQRNMMRGVSNIIRKPCIVNEAVPLNHTIKRNLSDQGYTVKFNTNLHIYNCTEEFSNYLKYHKIQISINRNLYEYNNYYNLVNMIYPEYKNIFDVNLIEKQKYFIFKLLKKYCSIITDDAIQFFIEQDPTNGLILLSFFKYNKKHYEWLNLYELNALAKEIKAKPFKIPQDYLINNIKINSNNLLKLEKPKKTLIAELIKILSKEESNLKTEDFYLNRVFEDIDYVIKQQINLYKKRNKNLTDIFSSIYKEIMVILNKNKNVINYPQLDEIEEFAEKQLDTAEKYIKIVDQNSDTFNNKIKGDIKNFKIKFLQDLSNNFIIYRNETIKKIDLCFKPYRDIAIHQEEVIDLFLNKQNSARVDKTFPFNIEKVLYKNNIFNYFRLKQNKSINSFITFISPKRKEEIANKLNSLKNAPINDYFDRINNNEFRNFIIETNYNFIPITYKNNLLSYLFANKKIKLFADLSYIQIRLLIEYLSHILIIECFDNNFVYNLFCDNTGGMALINYYVFKKIKLRGDEFKKLKKTFRIFQEKHDIEIFNDF